MIDKKIKIRVDANSELGHGHFYRCISIASMLSESYDIYFYSIELPFDLIEKYQFLFSFIKISNEYEFLNEISEDEIIILDGYKFNSNYQYYIKNKKSILVYIDDFATGNYYADLIINSASNINVNDYKAQPFTYFALGFEYLLLRPAFLNVKLSELDKKDKSLFICFGGSDSLNFTLKTFLIALNSNFFESIDLLVGNSYKYFEELNEVIAIHKKHVRLHCNLDDFEMVNLIKNIKYAIVPSSGILNEVKKLNCIPISGYYIDNQKNQYLSNISANQIIDAGTFKESEIKLAIQKVIKGDFSIKNNIVEINFAQNIKYKFNRIENLKKINLKRITKDDLNLTYNWAINKSIRQFAFKSKIITFNEHEKWFLNKLNEGNCFYYILFFDSTRVGSIRFDVDKNSNALISYLIDPNYQGLGLGKLVLVKGIKQFLIDIKQSKFKINNIIGYVKNENHISKNIFEQLHFNKINYTKFIKFSIKTRMFSLNLALLLSGKLGLIVLKKLYNTYNIKYVFTDSISVEIINYCYENYIPCFVGNPRCIQAVDFAKKFEVDVIFSINYLFLIQKELIDLAKIITLNIHGSLLPKYRGRTPHVWAIINNEKITGITVHKIDEGCDTGEILIQHKIKINNNSTGGDLLNVFNKKYPKLVINSLKLIEEKKYKLKKQNEKNYSYFEKRTPIDGLIDWNKNNDEIINWVRAQAYPYPGAFSFYKDKKIIIDKVSKSRIKNTEKQFLQNGEIVLLEPLLIVKTKNGFLKIEKIRGKFTNFTIGEILR